MSWREIPVVGTVGLFAIDLLLYGGDVILSIIVSLGEVIPILSLAASFVAPELDWLPESLISSALLVAALLYIGVSIARLVTS